MTQFILRPPMSNVPFMIDDKREVGLYFDRKNIRRASELMTRILAVCGVAPVIPSLFVENTNEGDYVVAGQFNDIEAFCPGSINDHISHVERSAEGRTNIIVGVTRVGYNITGEESIKAQVMVH